VAASDGTGDVAVVPDGGDAGDAGPLFTGPCTPPPNIEQPPAMLTLTGCMDANMPTRFASIVIPYEVQSPLWADGAVLSRGFVMPAGAKIHVKDCAADPSACPVGPADDGKWVFPAGTVMIQNLSFDGKVVETRLLAQWATNSWIGYAYQWNEAQTAATLVPDERGDVSFNTGQHTIAWHDISRVDCTTCHSFPAGWTLGPETAQLNRMVGGMNQIDRLQAMGLFDAPLPTPYKAALTTPYAGQAGSPAAGATLEDRARSYLHANCSSCHRPDGQQNVPDLRRDVTFKDTGMCNGIPTAGDQGVIGALIVTPGMPSQSLVWLRMNAPFGQGRMPFVGSYVVDQAGLDLVEQWITGISSCPQ
jgi:mono/diheme cytochrome c family protein